MLTINDILNHIEIKQKHLADKIDQELIVEGFDPIGEYIRFKDVVLQEDNFYTYTFQPSDFAQFGYLTAPQISLMVRERGGPEAISKFLKKEDHEILLNIKRNQVAENYTEYNSYYRELRGLPPLRKRVVKDPITNDISISYSMDEEDFYYLSEPIPGIKDITRPVHEFDYTEKILLEHYKFPQDVLERLPYLKHIYKNISIFTLRDASYFDIVWSDIVKNSTNANNTRLLPFIDHYRIIRRYYMANHYSNIDNHMYDYYERVQCIMLLLATLANVNASYPIEKIASRILTTEEVHNLLSSYGVPKYNFTPKYLNILASKLNTLVFKKGTNEGLGELSSMFHEIKLFKYFLVKTINKDYQPGPDGEIDETKMYSLYYVKTPLDVDNPYPYLADKNNFTPYLDVVNNDKRWGDPTLPDDYKLENLLKKEPFSWAESKYLGIDNIVDLGWMSLKIATLYRWFIDNKHISEKYKINYEYGGEVGLKVSVYELFIYLQVLVFYKYKRKPSIPDTTDAYFQIVTLAENLNTKDLLRSIDNAYKNVLKTYKNDKDTYVSKQLREMDTDIDYKTMRYADLNAITDSYFLNKKINKEVQGLMDKTMHFEDTEEFEYMKEGVYKSYNRRDTPDDDQSVYERIRSEHFDDMHKGILTTKEDSFRNRHKDLVKFLTSINSDESKMYNNYGKFEINIDILKHLYELRAGTKSYKDYQMIDTMIKAMHVGRKIPEIFRKQDGTYYNDLLEYLIDLNPSQNTSFLRRIQFLQSDKENYMSNFNSEIIEVINTLRSANMLNPEIHTHANDALEYMQRLYSDNEVMKYLETLVDFFKSYTQDIVSKGAVYILDDGESTINVLDDLLTYIKHDEWDIGHLALMMTNFPTETLKLIRDHLFPYEVTEVADRLEIFIPDIARYKEIATSGLHLT